MEFVMGILEEVVGDLDFEVKIMDRSKFPFEKKFEDVDSYLKSREMLFSAAENKERVRYLAGSNRYVRSYLENDFLFPEGDLSPFSALAERLRDPLCNAFRAPVYERISQKTVIEGRKLLGFGFDGFMPNGTKTEALLVFQESPFIRKDDLWKFILPRKPEIEIPQDLLDIFVLHEIGHGIFPFDTTKDANPFGLSEQDCAPVYGYKSEAVADGWGLKKHFDLRGDQKALDLFIGFRALDSFFSDAPPQYHTAMVGDAILKDLSLPSYRESFQATRGLIFRSAAMFIQQDTSHLSSEEFRKSFDFELVEQPSGRKFSAWDVLRNPMKEPLQHHDMTKMMQALRDVLCTNQQLSGLERHYGELVLKGFETYHPKAAAGLVKKSKIFDLGR